MDTWGQKVGQLLWQKEVETRNVSELESRNEDGTTQKTGGDMRQSIGQKGEVWP